MLVEAQESYPAGQYKKNLFQQLPKSSVSGDVEWRTSLIIF